MGGVRWVGYRLVCFSPARQQEHSPSLYSHTSAWFRCRTEPLICGVETPALHFRSLHFSVGILDSPRSANGSFWGVAVPRCFYNISVLGRELALLHFSWALSIWDRGRAV